MTKAFVLLLSWLLITLSLLHVDCSPAGERITSIKEGLSRWVCHDYYWQGTKYYPLGKTLPLEIKIEGDQFFIWIDHLEVTERVDATGYFSGRIMDGRGVVIIHEAYNMKSTPPLGEEKRRRYFESGHIIKEKFNFPSNCTPVYDPMTPQKESMLRALDKTLEQEIEELRWYTEIGVKEVTATIADFNTDYFSTYVLIDDRIDRVYVVNLNFWYDDDFKELGVFPIGRIYPERFQKENLLEKIRKHAIVRKVRLTPANRNGGTQ